MQYGAWHRRGRRRLGFAGKLAAASSILLVLTCTALTWALTDRASQELSLAAIQRGWTLAQGLAAEAELGVLAGDKEALRASCDALLGRQDLVSCAVADARGRLLVGVGEALPGWLPGGSTGADRRDVPRETQHGRVWEFSTPVLSASFDNAREELQFGQGRAGERSRAEHVDAIGYVILGLSTASVDASQARLWMLAASFATLITLLGIAAAVALARSLTRPIQSLLAMTRAISEGHLDASVFARAERSSSSTTATSRSRSRRAPASSRR